MRDVPTTVGSTVYQQIKQDIIYGRLAPGAKLKLSGLKDRYAASLSTLRETLNRLASEGFVDAPSQRGFFVREVSAEDLHEIASLRILLECHALEMSLENGDTEWEGNLVAAHHKLHLMEQRMLSGDVSSKETWKRYDWEFHLATIQACRSQNLLDLHSILYDKYLRYQNLVLTHRGEVASREHADLLEAAIARDADRAKALLKAHVVGGLQHTSEAMGWEMAG
ncbi:GntR family transcriptional regulator [Marimonas sp. MJW-29]|uniref:GntR family transcriptional regulator n=1 Tax=Sulfitobacter sediminis TaxID=3234186 RepID=A0ABV3RLW5_9RHOB